MPIEEIKQRMYLFIRERSESHIVRLENLQLWAKQIGITQQEMGYALHLLKESGAVFQGKKYGYVVR